MARFGNRLRRLVMRAAFACTTAFALNPSAQAQWFLPFGAAPPAEIGNRLRAEGYVLARPLERRDTVYLADIARGPRGRERLVIDAWSGEILQRFVARRGGFIPEGGEFSEPRPLGPPPARDFREGNYDRGPPAGLEQPKAKARQRPAAIARKGGEPKPAAPPAESQSAGGATPAAAPSTTAPGAPAPAPAATPSLPSNPNTAAQAPPEAKETFAPGRPPAAEKPGEKKVNDVPVNPLD